MATNTKNVIVGAAALFVSVGNSSNDAGRPQTDATALASIFGSGASARTGLMNNASGYREVGYTTTGLEVSYEPVYGEVQVDQLLDAARLFKQSLKVMLKSELTEATLENLQLSWGQLENVYSTSSDGTSVINVPTLISNDSTVTNNTTDLPAATLKMAAGALGDAPVERVLIAVGQAPAQIGVSKSVTEAGTVISAATSSPTSVARNKERVYVARRVVSIDTTMHAMKRDSATVFPVNFRCLPDSDPKYAGAEYGVVIDRVFGTY
jgi:hypothetical protein